MSSTNFLKCCKCLAPMPSADSTQPTCENCRRIKHYRPMVSEGQRLGSGNGCTNQKLSAARAAQQAQFDKDKVVYQEKMREKERKKLLETLSRYKGVGELGNRMQEERLTSEEKAVNISALREMQQQQFDREKVAYLEKKASEEEKVREKERKKLLETLSRYKGVGELGNRMQEERLTSEEKAVNISALREMQQQQFDREKVAYLEKKASEEEKVREKERKKLLETLSRYKGVGELGNRMQEERLTSEEKAVNMSALREMQQQQFGRAKVEYVEKKASEEEKVREQMEHQKLLEKFSNADAEVGHRMQNLSLGDNEKRLQMASSRSMVQQEKDNMGVIMNNENQMCAAVPNISASSINTEHLGNEYGYLLGGRQIYEKGKGDHPLLSRLAKTSN